MAKTPQAIRGTQDIFGADAEAFAFVNLARFAVPLRIGLALGTVPWVQANVIDKVSPFLQRMRERVRPQNGFEEQNGASEWQEGGPWQYVRFGRRDQDRE